MKKEVEKGRPHAKNAEKYAEEEKNKNINEDFKDWADKHQEEFMEMQKRARGPQKRKERGGSMNSKILIRCFIALSIIMFIVWVFLLIQHNLQRINLTAADSVETKSYNVEISDERGNYKYYTANADMSYDYDNGAKFKVACDLTASFHFSFLTEYDPNESNIDKIEYTYVELKSRDACFSIYYEDIEKEKESRYHFGPEESYRTFLEKKDYLNLYEVLKSDVIFVKFYGKKDDYSYKLPDEQLEGLRTIVNLYHELYKEE